MKTLLQYRWALPLIIMALTFIFTGSVSAEDGGGY